MKKKPEKSTGFVRLGRAFIYSFHGLLFAFRNEAAFRQELCAFIILLVALFFLPLSILFKSVLFFANTMVLIVELLNSAIEAIVDMTSPEYHILSKRAKDLGSAAVLISLSVAIILWIMAVFHIITEIIP